VDDAMLGTRATMRTQPHTFTLPGDGRCTGVDLERWFHALARD
jgi:hypothetical protein